MKRAGFTMIELIFVIVILGILAAVAVPKLAATRQDAAETAMLSDYKAAIKTIASTGLATGAQPVLTTLFTVGGNNVAVAATRLTLGDTVGSPCVLLDVNATHITKTFTVSNPNCAILGSEDTSAIQYLGGAVSR